MLSQINNGISLRNKLSFRNLRCQFVLGNAAAALGLSAMFLLSLQHNAFAATEYAVTPDASEIVWLGAKEVGDSHTGTIKVSSGSVTIDADHVTGVEIVIDMNSIVNTDVKDAGYNQKLVDHLKSEDFFKTDEFKTASFKMNPGKKAKITDGKAKIEGKLEVRGKVQDFSIDLTGIQATPAKAEAMGKVTFDRTKFDVKYNSASFPNLFKVAKDKVIKNEINLDFKIAAQPKKK